MTAQRIQGRRLEAYSGYYAGPQHSLYYPFPAACWPNSRFASRPNTLSIGPRAGALEATLPRATSKSIAESVMQRLAGYHSASRQTRLVIEQNGKPILGRLKVQPGDRISIHVAVPGTAVLPRWLQRVKFWRGNPPIEASAERVIPGSVIVARNRKTRA